MSFLSAYIPTPDALMIDAMLTERAKAVSDDRTLDQRRADLFVKQLRGSTDGLPPSVQARDGTCRFATCSRPAMECDLDHEIPRPEGPTTGANLRGLCRRHHNIKTHDIAEPTKFTMCRPNGSCLEADLFHLATQVRYAA